LVDGDDKNKVEHWTDISESPKDQHWVALFIAGPRTTKIRWSIGLISARVRKTNTGWHYL